MEVHNVIKSSLLELSNQNSAFRLNQFSSYFQINRQGSIWLLFLYYKSFHYEISDSEFTWDDEGSIRRIKVFHCVERLNDYRFCSQVWYTVLGCNLVFHFRVRLKYFLVVRYLMFLANAIFVAALCPSLTIFMMS